VAPCVLVVGLDDVTEEHRRAAIRTRELERVVDAALAFARERREQQQNRQDEQERPGTPVRREGDEQAEWREQRVDGEHGQDGVDMRAERDLDRRAQENERQDGLEEECAPSAAT